MHKLRYVMMIVFKIFVGEKVLDILNVSGKQVVHPDDLIPFFDKSIAKMRTEETGGTGDKYSRHNSSFLRLKNTARCWVGEGIVKGRAGGSKYRRNNVNSEQPGKGIDLKKEQKKAPKRGRPRR